MKSDEIKSFDNKISRVALEVLAKGFLHFHGIFSCCLHSLHGQNSIKQDGTVQGTEMTNLDCNISLVYLKGLATAVTEAVLIFQYSDVPFK